MLGSVPTALDRRETLDLAPAGEARGHVRGDWPSLVVGELAVEKRHQLGADLFTRGDAHRNSANSFRIVAVARNTRLLTALSVVSRASATSR